MRRPNGFAASRDGDGRKQCVRCEQWLSEERFGRRKQSPDGLNWSCGPCANARRHTTTLEHVEELLACQGHACASCGDPFVGYDWQIDHNRRCCPGHRSCGKCIRSLLCGPCNRMIGHALEDPRRLRDGANYIELWKVA